ncbi:hypothetical protein B7R21_13270 [Subtercola boreus]|uniref:Large exoprotein n=1 Tax=Subtercola boreus TaxID=120213 RepID=A0A3E0VP88_9MICO|nr:hypothetical protein [Subtercola boreus]RFA11419.1 hypothetical protein B7R21_13270 [Subtercola boreus]
MTTDWLGGGLIVALAAVLWLIYLLPTWFRRNEYLSTERNTVRLQQTLRILAETSEVPDEVRVEANARSVAEQQRVLKKANAQNLLAERAGLQTLIEQGLALQAATRASEERTGSEDYETIVLSPRTPAPTLRQASLKLRRARAAASGILLLALVVTVLGAVQVAINGAWVVLVVGLVAATLCVTRLGRLARDARSLRARTLRENPHVAGGDARQAAGAGRNIRLRAATPAGTSSAEPDDHDYDIDLAYAESDDAARLPSDGAAQTGSAAPAGDASVADAAGASGWTPVPLPKPLYVGNRRIDGAMPVAAYARQAAERAEEALRAAARSSEEALRASQLADAAPDVTAAARRAATPGTTPAPAALSTPAPAPSRFASMGVVDTAETGAFDVDLILAKRRAG